MERFSCGAVLMCGKPTEQIGQIEQTEQIEKIGQIGQIALRVGVCESRSARYQRKSMRRADGPGHVLQGYEAFVGY